MSLIQRLEKYWKIRCRHSFGLYRLAVVKIMKRLKKQRKKSKLSQSSVSVQYLYQVNIGFKWDNMNLSLIKNNGLVKK